MALVYTHRRHDWVDPAMPVVGPAFSWSTVDHIVIHYSGSPNLIDGDPGENWDNIPAYIRAMHRDYTVNRGYSVGYNAMVDQRGHTWELRGDTFRCAANPGRKITPNTNFNPRAFAIKVAVDAQDGLRSPAVDAMCNLIAQCRNAKGGRLVVVPHSHTDFTHCPGDGIRAQIAVGRYETAPTPPPEPTPTPPPVRSEEDDLYIDHLVLDSVDTAPPVDAFQGGHASEWLQVAVIKAMFKQLTGSGEYTQAAAEKLNELLK